MTLWIVGTSVSIEDGGYVTRLLERAGPLGISIINLSVGDQTSVMGYMRVLEHCDDIQPADVVVWEYSMLDTLLTESAFADDDVHTARRMAWQCILERGAGLFVLLVAPRKHLKNRSACEAKIACDAATLGLTCIDTRELFSELGISDASSHYRDDRHPVHESPVIAAMVDRVLHHAIAPARPGAAIVSAWVQKNIRVCWQWQGIKALAKITQLPARTFRNSLVTIDAIPLAPDTSATIPTTGRVVGIGIVSTHGSGGIWCGHSGCPPTTTRLPSNLPYAFLLRTTGLPCRPYQSTSLTAATERAYRRGEWADYGQDPSSCSGEIAVFGVLCETQSHWRAKAKMLLHFYRQRLHTFLRRHKNALQNAPE